MDIRVDMNGRVSSSRFACSANLFTILQQQCKGLTNRWRLIDLISIRRQATRENFVDLRVFVISLSPPGCFLYSYDLVDRCISFWRLTDETIGNLFRIDLACCLLHKCLIDWLQITCSSIKWALFAVIDVFLSMRTTYFSQFTSHVDLCVHIISLKLIMCVSTAPLLQFNSIFLLFCELHKAIERAHLVMRLHQLVSFIVLRERAAKESFYRAAVTPIQLELAWPSRSRRAGTSSARTQMTTTSMMMATMEAATSTIKHTR